MTDHPNAPRLTRRGSLAAAGALLAAVAGWRTRSAEAAPTCVLTPELTEGPYYIAGERVRRDITEGKPGTALALRIAVVDASSCRAVKGAAVDIWHCDASGVYSGFGAGAGEAFLRGVQMTDATGVATFRTIYPGWYPGRAVHVHLKVHIGGNVVHTGQLFFPEQLTDVVYRRPPYSARPGREVRNPSDAIFRNGGDKGLLRLKKSGSGYVGTITTGVHTA